MLELYREALRIRREHPALGDGQMSWRDTPDGVLGFRRQPGFTCFLNVSGAAYELPTHDRVLLGSGDLADGCLPVDHAVWLAG